MRIQCLQIYKYTHTYTLKLIKNQLTIYIFYIYFHTFLHLKTLSSSQKSISSVKVNEHIPIAVHGSSRVVSCLCVFSMLFLLSVYADAIQEIVPTPVFTVP